MIRAAAEKVVKLFKPTPAATLADELAKADAAAADALAKFVAEPTDANGDACEAAKKTAERLRWRFEDASRREREAAAEAERQRLEAERAAMIAERAELKTFLDHGYRERIAPIAERAAAAMATLDDVVGEIMALNEERNGVRGRVYELTRSMTLEELGLLEEADSRRQRYEALNQEHDRATEHFSDIERAGLRRPFANPKAYADAEVREEALRKIRDSELDATPAIAARCHERIVHVFRTRSVARPEKHNTLIATLATRPHR